MSDDKSYLLNRAKGAVLSRDFSLAARLYKTLLKSEPNNIELLSQLGSVYVREGNDEKALTAYQSVIAKDPGNFSALNSLGGIYRRLGRYEDSIAVLETALAAGVNENAVYYNMGHTYKLMGNYEDAADCFITVIEENPNDVLAYNHLGSIQAARGDHQKALQTYSRALQLDRNHPILHYNSAKSYIALGKLKDARAAYENALRSHPGWVEAMDDYAHLLIKMNRYIEAQDTLLQAKKIDEKNMSVRNSLGVVYEHLGKYDAAQSSYNEVLSEEPDNYTAQLGLSSVLKKQKKYEEAAAILTRMEKKNPDDTDITLHYASILLKMSRLAEVVGRLNRLYAQDPDNPELLNLVSQYALLKNEEFRIKGFFAKLARVSPEYIDHFKDIAELYYDKKEFDKAEKNIKTYLSRKSNDAHALLLLGKIFESMHQLRKALETYKKALDTKEGDRNLAENSTLSKELQDSVQRVGEMLLDEGDSDTSACEPPCECVCPPKLEEDLAEEDGESDLGEQALGPIVPFDENEILEGLEEPLEFETLFEEEEAPEDTDDDVIDMSQLVSDDEPIDFNTINSLDDPFEESGSKPNQYVPDEDPEFLDVDGEGYNFEEEDIADDEEEEEIVAIMPDKKEEPFVPPPPLQYPPYPQYPSFQEPSAPPRRYPEKKAAPEPLWDEDYEDEIEAVDEKPVKKAEPKKEKKTEPAEDDLPIPDDDLFDSDPVFDTSEEDTQKPLSNDTEEPGDEEGAFDEPVFTEPEMDDAEQEQDPAMQEKQTGIPDEDIIEEEDEYQLPDAIIDDDDLELPLDEEAPAQPEQYLPSDSFPQIDDEEPVLSDEAVDFLENDENAGIPIPDKDEQPEGAAEETDSVSSIAQRIAEKISNLETLCDTSESIQYNDLSSLLENLKDLCNYLPENKKTEYLSSLDHLRLDFLLQRMSGAPGLLRTAQNIRDIDGIPDDELDDIELDKITVQKTLEYLRELVQELPDKKIAAILGCKISDFLLLWK